MGQDVSTNAFIPTQTSTSWRWFSGLLNQSWLDGTVKNKVTIDAPIKEVQLNESKHRKITYKVYRVEIDVSERFKKAMSAIMAADNIDALERTWKQCGKVYEACDEKQRNELDSAKSEKMEALKNAS
jgi:hypothetical protein